MSRPGHQCPLAKAHGPHEHGIGVVVVFDADDRVDLFEPQMDGDPVGDGLHVRAVDVAVDAAKSEEGQVAEEVGADDDILQLGPEPQEGGSVLEAGGDEGCCARVGRGLSGRGSARGLLEQIAADDIPVKSSYFHSGLLSLRVADALAHRAICSLLPVCQIVLGKDVESGGVLSCSWTACVATSTFGFECQYHAQIQKSDIIKEKGNLRTRVGKTMKGTQG